MNVTLGRLSCPFAAWRPRDGRVFDFFSFDTETTLIDDGRPDLTPDYVLGAACDGGRGVFVSRDNVRPFFEAHQDVPLVCHNAAFDLRVTDALLRPAVDLYAAVEAGRVWDTLVLKRLHALATAGHTARGECGLADCARAHLGVTLGRWARAGRTATAGRSAPTSASSSAGRPPPSQPST
jgi:hypothetical protein